MEEQVSTLLTGLNREDDARQMDALMAKLDAMRTQQAPEVKTGKPAKREAAGETRACIAAVTNQ